MPRTIITKQQYINLLNDAKLSTSKYKCTCCKRFLSLFKFITIEPTKFVHHMDPNDDTFYYKQNKTCYNCRKRSFLNRQKLSYTPPIQSTGSQNHLSSSSLLSSSSFKSFVLNFG